MALIADILGTMAAELKGECPGLDEPDIFATVVRDLLPLTPSSPH